MTFLNGYSDIVIFSADDRLNSPEIECQCIYLKDESVRAGHDVVELSVIHGSDQVLGKIFYAVCDVQEKYLTHPDFAVPVSIYRSLHDIEYECIRGNYIVEIGTLRKKFNKGSN